MIIDCHTHLGRNEHIKARCKDLLDSMDAAHIDKALVFAGSLNDYDNKTMLKEVKPHHDRLLPVAAAEPHKFDTWAALSKDAEDLATLYQSGDIVAVKFYTGYHHYLPGDKEAREYLGHLEDVGCPAIFHMGDCLNSVKCAKLKYAHPLNIDEVAVDYPEMNFIIAHMGYPWHRDAAEVCYKNKNVFSDISGFVYGDFDKDALVKFQRTLNEFLDIANSDKLLFGTDWPISNQGAYLDALGWCAQHTTNSKMFEVFTPEYMTKNIERAFKL
jgi:predicted TIM-barrel fold metal-dependent hydrolase